MARKFTTASQAAERFGVTARYVQRLCKDGKVEGARQFGKAWMVPASFKLRAQKPGPRTERK